MRFSGQEVDLVKAELKEAKDKLSFAEAEADAAKESLSSATEELAAARRKLAAAGDEVREFVERKRQGDGARSEATKRCE